MCVCDERACLAVCCPRVPRRTPLFSRRPHPALIPTLTPSFLSPPPPPLHPPPVRYDFGIMYDVFAPALTTLNIFGLLLSVFLMVKGLKFPSTKDCGSSGSWVIDFMWGTELYV